ncbi:exo-beta-N-acetylmuramidase NamZ domain-containing protein [Porphyromonas endodontalis]|uniref:exo-beta-N-acetylmuramidase NamZ family protein n=1 Tax=Porphyromonas endodontalis TaxID=28124 RepID=UPI0036F44674
MSNLAHKFLLRVIPFVLGVLFVGAPKLFATPTLPPTSIQVGAERLDQLLPLLRGKRVGLVSNHTGVIGTNQRPLVDSLLALNIEVCRLFSPEHGFRGTANAGASVASGKDALTGLPIISLYGNNKKPKRNQIADLDLILFDLQDVGTRFYTYISTMHYVMEAAAEAHITVVILDRPNPNDYIDGPLLTPSCQSFIGMHPIPVLHGLTVGELALMINGERWLAGGIQCDLRVVPIKGWQHGDSYTLPVAPSPNLKTPEAIRLYPSLCFFEATILSVGRGTPNPFTALGYPNKELGEYLFTPKALQGATDAK